MKRTIELKMRFVVAFTLCHYQSDLDIDFDFINEHDPDRFIWITRECGTRIGRFWKPEELPATGVKVRYIFDYATREHIVNDQLKAFRNCYSDNGHDFYLIEPKIGTFRKIRHQQAFSMLEEHTRKLHELWDKEKQEDAA